MANNVFTKLDEVYENKKDDYNKGNMEMDWLWRDLIYRNTICVMDGQGSSGKSTLAMQIAALAAFHLPFFLGQFPFAKKGPGDDMSYVLYICAEDPWPIQLSRMETVANAYELGFQELQKRIIIHNFFDHPEPSYLVSEKKRQTGLYHQLVEYVRMRSFDLIILDPFSFFYGGDENTNSEIANFYRLLKKMNTTTLLVHNQNKESLKMNGNKAIAARGAIAIREQARTRLILQANILTVEKMNFSPHQGKQIPLIRKNGIFWPSMPPKGIPEGAEGIAEDDEDENTKPKKKRGRKPFGKGVVYA